MDHAAMKMHTGVQASAEAVDEGERSGRLVAELEHVTKGFDGRAVVQDFSCRILRGDMRT